MRLAEPDKSRAILIGVADYDDPDLIDIRPVANNIADLATILTDPKLGGFRQDKVLPVVNPKYHHIGRDIARWCQDVDDVLLVYFSGHGLVDNDGSLLLAVSDTERNLRHVSALQIAQVQRAMRESPAEVRVLILDCCFSGRAIDSSMTDPESDLVGQIEVKGTCTLTSAPRNLQSPFVAEERYTVFSSELITLLCEGVADNNPLLSLDVIHRQLVRRLRQRNKPEPVILNSNTASDLGLVHNLRYQPPSRSLPGLPRRAPPAPVTASRSQPRLDPLTVAPVSTEAVVLSPGLQSPPFQQMTPVRDLVARSAGVVTSLTATLASFILTTQEVMANWVTLPVGVLCFLIGVGATIWLVRCLYRMTFDTSACVVKGHSGRMQVHFQGDGQIFAFTGGDSAVALNTDSWRPIPDSTKWLRYSDVAFSPTAPLMARTAFDRFEVVDTENWRKIVHPEGGRTRLGHSLTFSPRGTYLACTEFRGTTEIWRTETWQPVTELGTEDYGSYQLAFSPDERIVVTTGLLQGIQIWDISDRRLITSIKSTSTTAVAFSMNGAMLAAGGPGSITFWRTVDWHEVLRINDVSTGALDFSPDGKLLAYSGRNCAIHLVETNTWTRVGRFVGHQRPPTALTFSPDSRLLASTSRDSTIRLWRLRSVFGAPFYK